MKHKKKSKYGTNTIRGIVTEMASNNNFDTEDMAYLLDVKTISYRNKLALERFTIQDFLSVVEACNGKLTLEMEDGKAIELKSEYICSAEVLERINKMLKIRELKNIVKSFNSVAPEQFSNMSNEQRVALKLILADIKQNK